MLDMRSLKKFCFRKVKGGYIDITLPVVVNIDGGLIELRIKAEKESYSVWSKRDFFSEANADLEYYYNIFEKFDKCYHYDISVKRGRLFKEYNLEQSVVTMVDEFVRLILNLDNFIINNSVIGNEEKFN